MAFLPRASLAAFSTLALLATAACDAVVVGGPDDSLTTTAGAGGSTGAVVASSAVTTTGGATSGVGGAGGSGGSASECVVQPVEEPGEFVEPTCASIAGLVISHPVIIYENDDDGLLEAGEVGFLQVDLDEAAGVDFFYYPGVIFESATAGVTVSTDNWLYGIAACQTNAMTATIEVGNNVAPGTVVTVTARVGMLNHDCPDAYAIEIPITIH